MSRHDDIAECIRSKVRALYPEPYLDVRIEDFAMTSLPSAGIIISPEDISENPGTSDRDEFVFTTTIIRITHSLGSSDQADRSQFIEDMLALFHRKRLSCLPVETCQLNTTVSVGKVAIPSAWQSKNNSVAAVTLKTPIRVTRDV